MQDCILKSYCSVLICKGDANFKKGNLQVKSRPLRKNLLSMQDIRIIAKSLDIVVLNLTRQNADFLDVSNVFHKDDLEELHGLIRRKPLTRVLVNIEHPETLENLESILDVCDGVIICRNWLANYPHELFNLQKQQDIISECKSRGKLVFAKGLIMESLAQNDYPSFAEINDVTSLVEKDYKRCSRLVMVSSYSETLHCINGVASSSNI